VLNQEHEFFSSESYRKELLKQSRSLLKQNDGSYNQSGVGAREVFGMEDKGYV